MGNGQHHAKQSRIQQECVVMERSNVMAASNEICEAEIQCQLEVQKQEEEDRLQQQSMEAIEQDDIYPDHSIFQGAWDTGTGTHSTPEILSNKSSKKLYKLAAKEFKLKCKMSNECRCDECQSHYFDCEFDDVSTLLFLLCPKPLL